MSHASALANPPKETRHTFHDRLVIWALFALAAQGVGNFLLRGTGLVWWKQAVIVILFAFAFKRSTPHRRLLGDLSTGCILAGFLLFMSYLAGIPAQLALYGIFFYLAWMPFYVLGATARPSVQTVSLLKNLSFWALIITAIGITVQLLTPYLDFLVDEMEYESVAYRADAGEAQRLGFVYVASTLVMPTCMGFFTFFCLTGAKYWKRTLAVLAMGVSAIPTGSLASLVVLAGTLVIALRRRNFGGRLMLVSLLGAAVVTSAGAYTVSPQITAQIDRIIENTSQNESNEGRLYVWQNALDQISRASFVEHIAGRGLGASIDPRFGGPILNGESSFFQAYLEGGIIGLFLRLWPFLLLFRNVKVGSEAFWYGGTLLAVCAIAPLFQAYGLQCVLGYLAGLHREPEPTRTRSRRA